MTEQTRGSRRVPSHRPLQLKCQDWEQFVRTYARDIGSGGMFIQTDQAPAILSFIDVVVDLPEGQVLQLEARVVHIITPEQAGPNGTPGIGVEFQNVTPELRERVQQLIKLAAAERSRTSSGVHDVQVTPGAGARETTRRTPSTPTFQAVILKTSSAPPGPSAKEEKATLMRLAAELKAISAKNDYEILGVDQRVDEAGLRTAFIAQSKLYHPDLFAQYASPDIRQAATQIFVRIKRAFTQLTEKVKQRDPDAAAAGLARALGVTPGAQSSPGTRMPLRSPPPPSDNPIVTLLADAKRHVVHKRYEEAQRTLERALSIDPNHRDVKIWFYTVRARRLKLANDVDNALEHYKLVLELDEKNLEATKELRAVQRPSMLTGLRTKKD